MRTTPTMSNATPTPTLMGSLGGGWRSQLRSQLARERERLVMPRHFALLAQLARSAHEEAILSEGGDSDGAVLAPQGMGRARSTSRRRARPQRDEGGGRPVSINFREPRIPRS